MSVLKIKDQNGNWIQIPTIKGEDGQDYVLTESDKQEIADLVDAPVEDVQVNNASIVTDGVANIPIGYAKTGLIRISGNSDVTGLYMNSSNGATVVHKADDNQVKAGTMIYRPITPANQHNATFYGLAKASGDTTQAQSNNAVGTYTDEAKVSIQSMLGINMDSKVDKDAIENAGIINKTYTTIKDIVVTTSTDSTHAIPYAESSNGSLFELYKYRITYDNTEYILPGRTFFNIKEDGHSKGYTFIGDLSLYTDTSGVCFPIDEVPFCFVNEEEEFTGIQIYTTVAGEHNIKIERINLTKQEIPKSLIWDTEDPLIKEKRNSSTTYHGISIGNNSLKSARGAMGIGFSNIVTNEFGVALGVGNQVTGTYSTAIGSFNTVSGNYAFAECSGNTSSGLRSHAEGEKTTASGGSSHAEGVKVIASGNGSHAEGWSTHSTSMGSHAEGILTYANGASSHAEGSNTIANASCQHVFGKNNVPEPSSPTPLADGKYVEIVGNGTSTSQIGNARSLDWEGNEYLAGEVYVNCNNDSTGGEKLVKKSDLDDYAKTDDIITDVQINGTSAVTNRIANIPVATNNNLGVVRTNSTYGVYATNGTLAINNASESDIKSGTNSAKPLTPNREHMSTFYGLAKAAGDTTQSQSSNTIGTYTNEAKTAIKQMLDVKDDYDSLVVEVSGTDPVITGKPSYRYNCGELYTLTVTPPASGTMDIIFTSGTTPTVLSLPNTVKMPDWWAGIETNTTYEMCITDGTYCGVMSWAT